MRYIIDWTEDAHADLDEIRTCLESFSLQTARRILTKIIDQANSLTDFPYRCQKISESSDDRRLVIDSYSAFYEIHENVRMVRILHVWHQSRDISQLM